ncbi:hypothetical protein D477_002668 [Arthrobacter crystallopoietes BAB-32]|uniref:Uncharacterized protein n=1 Tax=Arthrobacter crystallopoietes BAB-32 TaxID=1246476 RepID=N1V359_9MICC|nr:hypothetical protein [Arthrobacter crystallopoietes]EMY35760.1 hypothetical protein D477_002668 [Arthrobacter crystallopoietes BAB-32]
MTTITKPGTPTVAGMREMRVALPDEYFAALNFVGDQTGESQRSIVRRAVGTYLREAGFPHLIDVPATHTTRTNKKGTKK